MKFFWFTLLLAFVFSCSDIGTQKSKLIDFVPENTHVILKTSNLQSFQSSLNNSDFLKKFSQTKAYKNIESKLQSLLLLKPKSDILICFSQDKNDSLQYSIITKYSPQLFLIDSLKNYVEESLVYKNATIKKSTFNNTTFYSAIVDSTFFASSSKSFTKSIFNKTNKAQDFEKIYATTANDQTASILTKPNNPFIKSFFFNDSLNLNNFTNYIAVDVDISQDEILINGITHDSDSFESLISVFTHSKPQENTIQNVTPSNSDGFMSFTFDNFKIFKANLAKFNKNDSLINNTSLFDNIIEVGSIYANDNRAIVLNTVDIIATKDALLSEQNKIETYRQIDIYTFSKLELFSNVFSPLITYKNTSKYCVLDNFFIFADSLEMLQNIIANYQNKTTINEQRYFKNVKEHLTDESSLLLVANPSLVKDILIKHNFENVDYKLDNYNTSALQFIYDTNFAHVNGIIKKSKTRAQLNSISEEFNIKLENDLLNAPQFVINHVTKEKEIVVQDVNNNLYLISSKGKIIWNKQLNGPILGPVEQIDIYKNGRLQLAFATPNILYVIDRNGKDVAPFPVKLNDIITQPLSIFDYNNDKDYRLMLTQGKHIVMYNLAAKLVKGFNFKVANDAIICQPKHFRIDSKDYITFKTKDKLYILNRVGATRVTPKTASKFSTEAVYVYQNKFVTTSNTGDLLSMDANGNISTRSSNLTENHYIETTNKTIVLQNDNKLTINNRTIELDFGNYTKPKIFYLNDKIYIATTDLQSQKVFLYDSQAKLIHNLPVYGNSSIDLKTIDKGRNLKFVTKGENNSIILYHIN